MKNNYIKIIMNNRNEFRTNMRISIPSIGLSNIDNVDVKIDTGCPKTSIPIKKLGVNKADAYKLKQIDCNNNDIQKEISFGVNDSDEKRNIDITAFKKQKYNSISSVTFLHTDATILIDGIRINNTSVRLSYDRTGNILIGMDILKEWDIHIGTIKTGETIFLACPKIQLNDDYLLELDKLFNIGTLVSSASYRNR